MTRLTRHVLPVLAALALLLGGPQRERFDVIHGLRLVLVLILAAALMFSGRLARAQWRASEWACVAGVLAMAIAGALASSPAYALPPLALWAGVFAVALGTSWRTEDRELWLTWMAIAATTVAALGLLEAMGVGPESIRGRGPSATMGQRNALAHFLVLASPTVWRQALKAEARRERWAWLFAAALIAAVVVHTRCRAAWLVGPAVLIYFSLRLRTRLVAALVGLLGFAVVLSGLGPSGLRWASSHPLLSSWQRLFDASSGSGAGRLVEWKDSLQLFVEHPLLGVGPGHWYVEYGLGRGADHFAHSDWVALFVERGIVGAALVLLLAMLLLREWIGRREVSGEVLVSSTMLAAAGLGVFDSVLQLPAPLLFLGLVCFVGLRGEATPVRAPVAGVGLAVVALLAALSFTSRLLSTADSTPLDRLELAAALDPLDGELRVTLAEAWISAGQCDRAEPHIDALRRLLPRHSQWVSFERACAH